MPGQSNIQPGGDPFIGRERERQALGNALRLGERLISIIGPSGMGKTRLARQVALDLAPELDDAGGAWFCDLSAAHTREDLFATVAVALGIKEGAGQPLEDEIPLAKAIADRGPLLLILDNFEYMEARALDAISTWLGRAPELQIVATSLLRLGVEGESLFELGPLDEKEAVALYQERANRAWSGDRGFYSGEQRAIEDLVERLDRLPLAIELAAARVRVLPPRAMLTRIEDRFDLLRSRETGRHSSLEYAIQCSWDLLEPAERLALARSSVFAGGFTLDAAEVVLASDAGKTTVLDLLEGLRDKALLQLDSSDPPRFSMYESLQAFASRELVRAGEREVAERRHTAWFLEQGERWAAESSGRNGPLAIERLVAERDNLVAVHRRNLSSAPAIAARAGLAASVALSLAGSPSAELSLVESSVAASRRADAPLLLARALRVRVMAFRRYGRLPECRQDLVEALALAQEVGDRTLEAYLWSDTAGFRWHQGELDEAAADLARALEISSEVDEPALAGLIRVNLGVLADYRGMIDEARSCFEEAREIFRRIGDFRYEARALYSIGHLPAIAGDLDPARQALAEARRLFHLATDRSSEADVLLALGRLELTDGRLDEASAYLEAALPIQRSLGNRRWEGIALANLGVLALERGECQLARRRLQEGLSIIQSTDDNILAAQTVPFLAAVEAIVGNLDQAEAHFHEARSSFEGMEDESSGAMVDLLEGFLDLAKARLAAQELRTEEAVSLVNKAFRRRAALRDDLPPSNELARAVRLLENALTRYAETGNVEMDGNRPSQQSAPSPSGPDDDRMGLLVGPDAEWFEIDGKRVLLRGNGPKRRLLQALVERRLLAPGVGMTPDELLQVGWPGEELHPSLASNRVYFGVSSLRKAGLAGVLLRHSDGYLLTPDVAVKRVPARSASR